MVHLRIGHPMTIFLSKNNVNKFISFYDAYLDLYLSGGDMALTAVLFVAFFSYHINTVRYP